MTLRLTALCLLAMAAACAKQEEAKSAEKDTPEAGVAEQSEKTEKAVQFGEKGTGDAAPVHEQAPEAFAEVTLDEMHPMFTRETVIKLNAIVQRSLDTVKMYDKSIKDIRGSIDAATMDGATAEAREKAVADIAKLEEWRMATKLAKEDMDAAVEELKASDEVYNENILAGMTIFVDKVEKEIREEHEKLSKMIAEA